MGECLRIIVFGIMFNLRIFFLFVDFGRFDICSYDCTLVDVIFRT